jgi:ABC-type sugar transport system substrate-binding protein
MRTAPNTRKSRRTGRALFGAVITVAALVLAACGSTGGGSSNDHAGTHTGVSTPLPSASLGTEQLSDLLTRAFLQPTSADDLDQVTLEALKLAAQPLTDAQTTLFKKCMSSPSCTTGSGKIVVADAESNGENAYRKVLRGEFTAQAVKYPQIGKIVYTDAHGDLQTFLSNFGSLISQKVDIITGDFDFGAALLPLIKQAKAAGIVVIPNSEPVPGVKPPADAATQVTIDQCQAGTNMGNKAVEALGSDKAAAIYTGVPGNTVAAEWQPCLKKVLSAHGWKVAVSGTTNWTPQGETQAANALAASGKHVDALFYDYGPDALVNALAKSGSVPAIFAEGPNVSYVRLYQSLQSEGKKFDSFIANGQSWLIRISLTAGMKVVSGQSVPPQITLPSPFVSVADVAKLTTSDMPAGLSVLSLLPTDLVNVVLG